ncbi:cytochrome c biogenesis protein CcdA [Aliishimia ponticola]|uniref:Cytochrome c biogenesis protein CcdA n=1 Tax=Aliishimia ponticola TaxID=2499833 RepID=A0A4S4N823_9RHOB|nr:cytochrome c biogenesis CcdA family protein [Aliishimia ponticola]THH35342.1 cytochrome c biogenesis protein CcdA [Aliishimia ponticola]
MDLFFAYLAGLLTLINPCVLPVLPIVLATALNADRRGPIALAAGMSLSFVTFGMVVATFGRAIGLTEDVLANAGGVAMLLFGLIMLVPALSGRFETALAGVSSKADSTLMQSGAQGLGGQFLGGLLLGAVWSPCIGPTLGGAIALASQGESLLWALLIMIFFSAGVSTLILGIGLGGQELIRSRAQALRGIAAKSKTILGVVFIAVGLMILFRVHHIIEAWAVRTLPYWLTDLSVMF